MKDEQFENFRHIHIQWWVLVKKKVKNDRELYQGYVMNVKIRHHLPMYGIHP
jgi:hypothetical protein